MSTSQRRLNAAGELQCGGDFRLEVFLWNVVGDYSMWYAGTDDGGTKRVKRLIGQLFRNVGARGTKVTRDSDGEGQRRTAEVWPRWSKGNLSRKPQQNGGRLLPLTCHQQPFARMESALRVHILPQFKVAALPEIGVQALQQFATDLRKKVSRQTVIHVLTTMQSIVNYAARCGTPVNKRRSRTLSWAERPAPQFPSSPKRRPFRLLKRLRSHSRPCSRWRGIRD